MSDHFAAFSFVDKITDLVPGKRARGTFAIPRDIDSFPPCLMAEAVGQLAAWVSMSQIGFRGRPVAALAAETRFVHAARPGDTLELAVEIDDCDDDAVAYRGWADANGSRAIELVDCLGPMLPLADFDDAAAMLERFELLQGRGAEAGRFHGVRLPRAKREASPSALVAQGTLDVPEAAPFFNDHFPRRPVFPATLLLDALIDLALDLAAESKHWRAGAALAPVRMTHVKVRSFTAPGTRLSLKAEMRPPSNGDATFMLSVEADGRSVATARVVIAEKQ
jgi:3-hydroxymyristoyl/3-hydroxydecanoyl-(acyl carrier protein) dehydratase